MDTTLKFQQSLPFSVFPVSSQLAALHTISQSSQTPNSCKSCGSYLTTHVRVVRNRQQSRVTTITCNACGRVHSTPLDKGNSATFSSRKRKANNLRAFSNHIGNTGTTNTLPSTQPSFPSSSSTTPASFGRPITSSKLLDNKSNNKKLRLRDMLKRNRENEQKRSNMPETSSRGLSAFLTTL